MTRRLNSSGKDRLEYLMSKPSLSRPEEWECDFLRQLENSDPTSLSSYPKAKRTEMGHSIPKWIDKYTEIVDETVTPLGNKVEDAARSLGETLLKKSVEAGLDVAKDKIEKKLLP